MMRSKLDRLQEKLEEKNLSGIIIPKSDPHLGEYNPPSEERLRFITGFDGSAGKAIVLRNKRAIFVDGRYTLQVKQQVDDKLFDHQGHQSADVQEWLRKHLQPGDTLGFDPWIMAPDDLKIYEQVCRDSGAQLVPVEVNPIDEIWDDRPNRPKTAAMVLPFEFAGRTWQQKWEQIKAAMTERGASHLVLSLVDSINWLFNIRGRDIPYNPFTLCYAILPKDGDPKLFIDSEKCTPAVRDHLEGVEICPYDSFLSYLKRFTRNDRVWVDPKRSPAKIPMTLEEAKVKLVLEPDPCILLKACKNEVELEGARKAHRRDGVAVTKFLAWLFTKDRGEQDEWTAAKYLDELRSKQEHSQGPSFDTISGYGPNGAIVHYRVDPKKASPLGNDNLYLVDSGGQYFDGTTDITRTVALAEPTKQQQTHYTLVLKGHLTLAGIKFPQGTSGHQLDVLARQFLWRSGLDFAHGTGHGVGSFLAVHEGPQNVSTTPNHQALLPGMIISNEPGYYLEGHYGIRIENLQAVVESEQDGFLRFETLTLVPYDRNLLDMKLLTQSEINSINAYHDRVYTELSPLLSGEDRKWLREATLPL